MKHSDLIDAIVEKSGLSRQDTSGAVSAMVDVITDSLKKGEEVRVTGLGTFTAVNKPARKGRNPGTGAEIDVPASVKGAFKAGKPLNDALKA